MKRYLIFSVTFLFMAIGVMAADDVSFTASAPQTVVQEQNFRLEYTVNTRAAKDPVIPSIENDFNILSGPNTSTSSRISITNGQRTSSTTVTYTYIISAKKEGEYTIPGATITVGKNQYTSNSLKIKVLPPDSSQPSSQGSGQSSGQGISRSSSTPGNISNQDLFMRAIVSKTRVHEQEALLLTYKVYFLVNLRSLSHTMPDLKDFHVQEVDLPQQKEAQMEHYNGRNYQTIVWSQYVLFPQQSGDLEIPSTSFEGIVSQIVSTGDIFDDFFNNGRYVDTKKELVTDKITIHVEPLPQGKSENFYGGVGEFSLSSDISETDIQANDAVTLKLVVSGTGNMKLIKTPEVRFPADFDIYDPKVDNKYSLKSGGQTGSKVFEYLVIPRHAGTYEIPPVEFQYYDINSGEYKTLSTPKYTLNVAKGQGSDNQTAVGYVSKEDLKYVGQDVRFKTTASKLHKSDDIFFGSVTYWILLCIPVILFLGVLLFTSRKNAEQADQVKLKLRKANSTATKRLKTARKLMESGKKDEFYDEILRALWGYASDKLSIPVAQLSKDNIENRLQEHGAKDVLSTAFIRVLDSCEFARYAPGDQSENMDKVYDEAAKVIGFMDDTIKR